jgi:lipoprotein-anchoring transpeptidase ErfK/SrfK
VTTARRRRILAVASAPIAAAVAVLVFAPSRSVSDQARPLPPPRAGIAVPHPAGLTPLRGESRWAAVRRAVLARAAPSFSAKRVAAVSTSTPEATTNILELLGTAQQNADGTWQRVRLAVLPNGTTGWVPESALDGSVVLDTVLMVNLSRFRATLFSDGEQVFSVPVGVGQPQSPTPIGEFYVRDVVTRYRSPMYGPIAFGTSARSAVLTDWPAGGFIGIHGTDQPGLIPGAVSHGCVRMRNADILRLAKLMPVGTPIIIVG